MIDVLRLTVNALFVTLSLILFAAESLLPPVILPPGAKFGLANVVTVAALYLLTETDVLIILSARIFLAGIFASSPSTMIFSASGGLLSLSLMILLKRTGKFSVVGVSAAGGFFHNVGQLVAAIFFANSVKLVNYLPVLGVSGLFVGLMIGLLSKEILIRVKAGKFF